MLPAGIALFFALSALVTSALAYSARNWRYAFAVTLVFAGALTFSAGQWLQKFLRTLSLNLHAGVSALAIALPLALVLWSLLIRRRNTPRHIPSINDDPTLRRYVEEKNRRARKRRQDDEALENSDATSL